MDNLIVKAKILGIDRWVEGYYFKHEAPLQCISSAMNDSKHYILKTGFADWSMPRSIDQIEIDLETLSRFTGMIKESPSKTGIAVYENDIFWDEIEEDDGDRRIFYIVTWINERASFAFLTLSEHIVYQEQGIEPIEKDFEGFYYELNPNSVQKMHYKGNKFDNMRLIEPYLD